MFQTCIVVLGACGMFVPLCKGFWLWHYRPCPGFLRFLSLRFLRCRLVSLTSVLKDSVSAADSALDSTPWCVCPVLISSLSVLLEEYGPISRGAGCFPCQFITVHGYHTQGRPECPCALRL